MQFEAGTRELELSCVQKVTSLARSYTPNADTTVRNPQNDYFVAVEPNSFGLPSVDTCPGRTGECEKDCYAIDAEYRSATHEKLVYNKEVLEAAKTVGEKAGLLRNLVAGYKTEADRLGIAEDAQRFRIHWSGDFPTEDDAEAWRTVITENPGIDFWVYTRSFTPEVNVVPILAGIENLDLFMSVDIENIDRAFEVLAENPDVRVAYLVDYYEDVEELRKKLGRTDGYRALACPENMRNEETGERKLPLVSEKGGACARCTYCIDKKDTWDVVFVKRGLKLRGQQLLVPYVDSVPIEIKPKPKKIEEKAEFVGTLALVFADTSLFNVNAYSDPQ